MSTFLRVVERERFWKNERMWVRQALSEHELHKRMTWDVANVEICYSLSYSELTDGASPIILVCEGLGLRMHNLRSDIMEFCGPCFVTLKCREQDTILIFCFVLFVWGRV